MQMRFTGRNGIIDISPLGYQNNTAHWDFIPGPYGFVYYYNPCYGFTKDGYGNLAVLQGSPEGSFSVGDQQTALFVKVGNKIAINYTSPFPWNKDSSPQDDLQHSQVVLTCIPKFNGSDVFTPNGENPDSYYTFEVKGRTVCPKKSNQFPHIVGVLIVFLRSGYGSGYDEKDGPVYDVLVGSESDETDGSKYASKSKILLVVTKSHSSSCHSTD
uniref:Uncharacterized protein n=1 Tax=Ciona savignyi TaxID=51511 RepID=H2Z8L2_CIOSA